MFGKNYDLLINQLLKRIEELENQCSKINSLDLQMQKLESHVISLRGLVNRRIGKGLDDSEESEEIKGTKYY